MQKRVLGIEITGSAKGAKKAAKETETAFAKMDKSVRNAAQGLAVGLFARGAWTEAQEAQKVAARTANVIETTGQAAGVTAEQVDALSSSISEAAAVDDELIQSAANLLLTFKQIKNEGPDRIFDRTTQAAVDLGAALGTDATSAAMTLGKALNDPVSGLSRLQRAGVSFTEQQREQIKAMAKAGDVAKAQGVILTEVESQFGGAAEAMATDADQARVAWENFQETIGTAVLPAVNSVLRPVTRLTKAFSEQDESLQSLEVSAVATVAAFAKFGPVGAAVGVAVGAFMELQAMDDVSEFADDVDKLASRFEKLGDAQGVAGAGIRGLDGLVNLGRNTRTVEREINALDDAIADLYKSGDVAAAAKQYALVETAARDAGWTAGETAARFDDYWTAVGGDGGGGRFSWVVDNSIEPAANRAARSMESAAERSTEAWGDFYKSLDDANERTDQFTSDFTRAFTGETDEQQAAMDVTEAFRQMNEALSENGNTFDIATEAGSENREAVIAARDEMLAYVEALIRTGQYSGGEIKSKFEALAAELLTNAENAVGASDSVAALAQELGLTPDHIDIAFKTPGYDTAILHFKNINDEFLRALNLADELEQTLRITGGDPGYYGGQGFNYGEVEGMAPAPVSTWAPGQSFATPAATGQMVVNVNAKGMDPRAITREVNRWVPVGT